jgi:hypothetical protein
MTYRPTFITQIDGSRCQWDNCGCASHAMAVLRHRKGIDPRNVHGWPPTPDAIRVAIDGRHQCGGTNLGENEDAVRKLYGVEMAVRYQIPWASFRSLIISGRGAVVTILYAKVHGTKFDASPNFYGTHGIYVNERRADGAYLVGDPLANGRRRLPQGWAWWPGQLLRDAAEAYPGTNAGCLHASFTRDTEV